MLLSGIISLIALSATKLFQPYGYEAIDIIMIQYAPYNSRRMAMFASKISPVTDLRNKHPEAVKDIADGRVMLTKN